MSGDDKVNILIVDDLPDKLLALSTILEGSDTRVVLAHSGREALRRLLDQEFAVILLDVNMPEMDGFETAAHIRRHGRCARTPIIFITAFADEMLTARGYSLGAVDYIMAPIVPEVLRTKVGVFVDLFRKSEQVRRHAEERVVLAREQAARLAAEEENRRKDEFLAMLSHELRNPLAPIRNALEILADAPLDGPPYAEARAVLSRQVRQLSTIVDDLLDVFRITHGKVKLRVAALDLVELLRGVVQDHRADLEADNRSLTVELPGAPFWVKGDRTRLAQVVSNLLGNAAKFTNAGDQISVAVRRAPDQERVTVLVRDTGIGIAPEVLPCVFETFAQADQGMDRRRGGLGLGLALVKAIVQLHGGGVHVSSAGVGEGATFSFWLPLSGPPSAAPTPTSAPAGQGGARRVLIIEDNEDTARSLQVLLRRAGHEVQIAFSGSDGVELATRWHPEVVFCDLGLPGVDGYGVARALRDCPGTRAARLVAISGYGQEEHVRQCREAGFDLHFLKPVDPNQLLQLLASS